MRSRVAVLLVLAGLLVGCGNDNTASTAMTSASTTTPNSTTTVVSPLDYCDRQGNWTFMVATDLEARARGGEPDTQSIEEIWGTDAAARLGDLWQTWDEIVVAEGYVEANIRWADIARQANLAVYERGCAFVYDLFGLVTHDELLWCIELDHQTAVVEAGERLGVEVHSPTAFGYPDHTAREDFEGYAQACAAAFASR